MDSRVFSFGSLDKPRVRIWFSLGLYLLVVLVELAIVLSRTHGQQVYAVDDAYIHAAIARNLVQHHVYGPTPYATVFASSSILWPYLVAGVYFIIGVHAWVPFVLNVLFGAVCVFTAERLFDALLPEADPRLRLAGLITFVFGASLVTTTFVGMEHVLHLASILLLLNFYIGFVRTPASDGRPFRVLLLWLSLAAALATSVRYESLLLTFPLCIALFVRRRPWPSIVVGVSALLPAVLFGIYVKSVNGTFLPDSVAVKSSSRGPFLREAWASFTTSHALAGDVTLSFILGCALLAYALTIRNRSRNLNAAIELLAIVLCAFLLHAGLGKFGWFHRYEVYLLGTLAVVFFGVCCSAWDRPAARALLAVFVAGLFLRGALTAFLVPGAALGIYEQQYQTGRFLARY